MLGLGHGFPLWFPDLDSNLPAAYRASGTRVGDLGYITDDGGFAYLFNVCAPADDAINIGRVPPNFKPLAIPDYDSPDRVWQGAYPRHSALTTSHVRQTAISLEASTQGIVSSIGGGAGFEFSCSSTQAAILVLPDGGERHESNFLGLFHECASENALHWYQHFNGPGQRREIRNGSLYLVTGFDKCSSWGTACYHFPNDNYSVSLRFLIAGMGEFAGTISHRWEVQAGVHQRNHQCDTTSDPVRANQTVFLRGYSISVRDKNMGLTRWFRSGKSPVQIFQNKTGTTKGPPIISSIPYGVESTSEGFRHDASIKDADMQGKSNEVILYSLSFSTLVDSYF
ncbi:hypothetical protein EV421DRAFT_1716647 [Armillaria borealis]|uniref:Uncharacterized protein n=1 Tax=Armillaria borealis TaxID=47425 RepID=A0AA39MIY2_9AGAR|nr:hypothetical protein EV421DRAFT_1716647 [Armillaria borealis]